MTFVVDRLEENHAVLQNEQEECLVIPLDQLPSTIAPGDVIIKSEGAYTIDVEQTQLRRERLIRLQERLRNR